MITDNFEACVDSRFNCNLFAIRLIKILRFIFKSFSICICEKFIIQNCAFL